MSPEILGEEDYYYKTDVYSFEIVLYYIYVGNLPNQNLRAKMAGKKIDLPSPSSSISECCIKLISMCLSDKPSERSSFVEIIDYLR